MGISIFYYNFVKAFHHPLPERSRSDFSLLGREDTLAFETQLKFGEDNGSPNDVLQLKVKVKFGGHNDSPNVVLELELDEDNCLPDDVLVSMWWREDYNVHFTLTTPPFQVGAL